MKNIVPEDYYRKKLKVYTYDGTVIVGELVEYSFDYDDDGKKYMELDFEVPYSNILTGCRDDEIEKIVIIGKSDDDSADRIGIIKKERRNVDAL